MLLQDESVPHRLIDLVKRKGEVRVVEATRLFSVDEKSLMNIARILSEPKIIELFYAVSGDVILKPGKEFERALTETTKFGGFSYGENKVVVKAPEEKHYVDDFLEGVRKQIGEKKRGEI